MFLRKFSRLLVRVFGVIRFLFFKTFYWKSFLTKGIFVIEKGASVRLSKGGKIEIGGRIHLSKYTELQSRNKLKIGKNLSLNSYSRIISFESIEIGNHVTIASFVTILDHDHRYEYQNGVLKLDGYSTQPINIGSNVWIGDKATILKGVSIGNNVVIGANSVINRNIPSNSVVVGNPGKVIKKLDYEP